MRRLWPLWCVVLVALGSCGNSNPEAQRDRNAGATISTVGCSAGELQTATTAWSDALTLSTDVTAYFAAGKSGLRYTTWFGAVDGVRLSGVKTGTQRIQAVLTSGSIGLHCNQSDCTPGSYGYTYPTDTKTRVIYLCETFFAAPRLGTDSRAGTIIHLLSQFTDLAGAGAHAYGTEAAKSLAITQPQLAVKNSDNFEYFFENTPAIVESAPDTSATTSTATTATTATTALDPGTTIATSPPTSATASTAVAFVATTSTAATPTSPVVTPVVTPATPATPATTSTVVETTTTATSSESIPHVAVKRAPSLSATTTRKSSVLRIAVDHLDESGPRRFTIERRKSGKWVRLSPSFDVTADKSVRLIDVRAGSYRVVLEAVGNFAAETSGILLVRR